MIFRAFVLLCASLCLCAAQRKPDLGSPPLDPAEGERIARELVAKMLAQVPAPGPTNGVLKIRDGEGVDRELRVKLATFSTGTNWVYIYETMPSKDERSSVKLSISHSAGQSNHYLLEESAGPGAGGTSAKKLTGNATMIPFAGSDFWVADLGFEFLHWPKQRLLRYQVWNTKTCAVLESVNPEPAKGGYARVVSWITLDEPYAPAHAEAFDASGRFKQFDPKSLEKVNGQYQVESIEMRNSRTHSRTVLVFDVGKR